MKKICFIVALAFCASATAQKIQPQGGVFFGASKDQVFVGFLGPKISAQLEHRELQFELGILGFPGLFLRPEPRLGLIVGPFLSIARVGKKGKLVFACPVTFVAGKVEPVPGIGVLF